MRVAVTSRLPTSRINRISSPASFQTSRAARRNYATQDVKERQREQREPREQRDQGGARRESADVEVRRPEGRRQQLDLDPFEQIEQWISPSRLFDPFPRQLNKLFRDPFLRDFTDATRDLRDVTRDFKSRGLFPVPLPSIETIGWMPKIDVTSDKDNWIISAELPGVPKDSVKVEVEGDTITIRGEKRSENVEEDPDKKVFRREISYGSFVRSFTLPDGVDPQKVKANYDHGVLKLVIPKPEQAKKEVKTVNIESSTGTSGSSGATAK